jgi:dUTP pyrophosphatase
MQVKIKKLHPNAVIPRYSKPDDAGLDLVATTEISRTLTQVTFGVGLAMEIPKGYVGLIFPRSSIRNYNIDLSNAVGVIDSAYRGEIQATFNKTTAAEWNTYQVGDRIAQIIIMPYPQIEFEEVSELSETERGTGGFGSTGK